MNIKSFVPLSIKRRLKKLFHSDSEKEAGQNLIYYCPACDSKLGYFNPLSSLYEENKKKYGWLYTYDDTETINPQQYSCPVCGASDRDRLYSLYLKEKFQKVDLSERPLLIEFAPSRPLQKFIKKHNVNYRTADLYMEDVDDKLDLMDMHTYPDNYCDIFICSHILEHVSDDKKALRELYRILKPGGWGILMVPINLRNKEIDEDPSVIDMGERWRRFGQDDHVRLYNKKGFMDRVKQAGFKLIALDRNYFKEIEFLRCGITERSVLYIVEKND
ncbi:class I SAM-dependent methyltransferase [Rhodocytophaga rosea]|uniref:Class I SAM-dependent methyltransferase n=1 Tax=Rhodocytophaga rosea TaxID=2704465 RepID=A0A6C0GNH0_9BACT|nr:class I SAM-dependent methyltransferase [Rhodocytophaga rosea]QHT69579.1 class I SAM-dependent methyltransferase [Rhodocytophaga rosea]